MSNRACRFPLTRAAIHAWLLALLIATGASAQVPFARYRTFETAHFILTFEAGLDDYAQSAATMVALGADVILMGYLSELGPIDPQYRVAIGNAEQWVSGQSFIAAYERLQEKVAEAMKAGESPVGYLQSLSTSTMEPAFIEHCRRAVNFSRDIAKKYLPQYQLKAKHPRMKKPSLDKRAAEAAEPGAVGRRGVHRRDDEQHARGESDRDGGEPQLHRSLLSHSVTAGRGMPLANRLTPANGDERAQVVPLLDAVTGHTGKRGRPRKRLQVIATDQG